MPLLVLLYILICYKIDLPVYWYEWALFVLLEIGVLCRVLYKEEIKSVEKDISKKVDLFSDV